MNNWGCATGAGSSHPSPPESSSEVCWEHSLHTANFSGSWSVTASGPLWPTGISAAPGLSTGGPALISDCNVSFTKCSDGAGSSYTGLRWELCLDSVKKGLSGNQPFPGPGQKPPPPICAVAESQKDQMVCKKRFGCFFFCAEHKSCCQSRKHCLGIVKPIHFLPSSDNFILKIAEEIPWKVQGNLLAKCKYFCAS